MPNLDTSCSGDHAILTVNWNYHQTGPGRLPITRVEIAATTIDHEGTVLVHDSQTLNSSDARKTSVNLTIADEDIQAGIYVVNVTATNAQGSASATCPSTILRKLSIYTFH